jgi:hypothetical protein
VEANAGSLSAIGRTVTVVFYSETDPWVIQAHVAKGQPIAIETSDSAAVRLQPGTKVVLIIQEGGTILKSQATVTHFSKSEAGWHVDLDAKPWQASDRRRYPRYGFKIPVTIRSVDERADGEARFLELRGETEDISLGGAWVKSRELMDRGTLVEFRAILSETESVRTLAIVAHANPVRGGMGLEFVEYVGGARKNLRSFLSRAA